MNSSGRRRVHPEGVGETESFAPPSRPGYVVPLIRVSNDTNQTKYKRTTNLFANLGNGLGTLVGFLCLPVLVAHVHKILQTLVSFPNHSQVTWRLKAHHKHKA